MPEDDSGGRPPGGLSGGLVERLPDRLPDRVTMPLLTLITQQSLDEDYLHAAERRVRDPERPVAAVPGRAGRVRTVTAAVIAVFGILVTTAAIQTSRNSGVDDASRSSLIERIPERRARVSALQDRIVETRDQITTLTTQLQQISATEQTATTRLRRLQTRTGFVAVTGEGVRFVIASAPDALPRNRVNDEDLALLVNGLWEAGAEAISINGQRLTTLGAIRISGDTILINRTPVSPPYTLLAIGDTRTLQADLADTSAGQTFTATAQQLGFDVTMDNEDRLALPAATLRTLRDVAPLTDDKPRPEEDVR